MPISRDEFAQGQTAETLDAKILAFLEREPEQAFTTREIRDAIEPSPVGPGEKRAREVSQIRDFLGLGRWENALSQLEAKRRVRARYVTLPDGHRETYWALRE